MITRAEWIEPDRARALVASGTDAFAIAHGPGWRIERFGFAALISSRSPDLVEELQSGLSRWAEAASWQPARLFRRLLVQGPGQKDIPVLLAGDPGPGPLEVVRESGLLFEVDFSASYSPGLFPDQRPNRDRLRQLRPARILNTFAYTCAFSVAAASVGAQTLSVDISKSSLARGRRNFQINHLPVGGHRFIAEDVPVFLDRLARRGETFDAILLDPPTFGRGGPGRPFRVERDLPRLISRAVAVAAPRARILVSTNFHAWSPADLRGIASDALPPGTPLDDSLSTGDPRRGSLSLWAGPLLA